MIYSPLQLYGNHFRRVLNGLRPDLHRFAELDADVQTYEAKGLAERMVRLHGGGVALEWADRQGGRFRSLADVFIDDTWGTRKFGGPMMTVEKFEELMS